MSFRFFIDRPIFATVIALVMTLSGIICAYLLPIAQFPNIVPPTVQVSATYNGADANTVAQVVTLPLEQQINGVEGMLYMSSTSTSAGVSTITVTFEVGYDLDIAAVDVLTREDLLAQVGEWVATPDSRARVVAYLNVHVLDCALRSPALARFLREDADLVYCDGEGIRHAAGLLGPQALEVVQHAAAATASTPTIIATPVSSHVMPML
jgi:hypothetical protein